MKLTPFQQAMVFTERIAPFNLVCALHLSHLPAASDVRVALDQLCTRFPMLASRVAEDRLVPAEVRPSLETHEHGFWRDVVEDELMCPHNLNAGPPWRVVLVPGPERAGHLVVNLHHLLCDGHGAAFVLDRLLTLLSGHEPASDDAPRAFPEQVSKLPASWRGLRALPRLLPFFARQMGEELAWKRGYTGPSVQPVARPRCRILPRVVAAETISRLSRAARQAGVTPYALMQAAMLDVIHQQRYDGKAGMMRGIAFADLRPFMEPKPHLEDLGAYIALTRFNLSMSDDLWGMAAEVNQTLYTSARRGDRFGAAKMSEMIMKTMLTQSKMRMGNGALSYLAGSPLKARYGDIALEAVHGFVANLGVGPEFTGLARLHGGRLWLDWLYLDKDMTQAEAEALALAFETRLQEAVSQPPTARL